MKLHECRSEKMEKFSASRHFLIFFYKGQCNDGTDSLYMR